MSVIVPDLDWYKEKSLASNLSPRCPFTTVESCPRYYQSLSFLGEAGTTKIDPSEDRRLLKFWKTNDLWPKTGEQETSVSGPSGYMKNFSDFCPEVIYEVFGYFASHLSRYSDEIDHGLAHKKLGKIKAVRNDWRWAWATLSPQHYTDCPIYSVLNHRSKSLHIGTKDKEHWYKQPWGIVILGVIITVIGGLILAILRNYLA
jgi:hypothetical protein